MSRLSVATDVGSAMQNIAKLPTPTQDEWEWQYEGACRKADPDLFFHPEGERGAARRQRAEAAKAYCESCPVLETCLDRSLEAREPFGVWGGLSEDERHAMLAGRLKKAS